MCTFCEKKVTDWDSANLSKQDFFDLFGPGVRTEEFGPEISDREAMDLCYYHQKIEDGLIDKPGEEKNIRDGMRIWQYRPLVHGLAWKWSNIVDMDYRDILQQGYCILADLSNKVDWYAGGPQVTNYVKRSVEGLLKTYIAKTLHVITLPSFDDDSIDSIEIDVDECYAEELNPEEQLLRKELLELAHLHLEAVAHHLTEREDYVVWNYIVADEPESLRFIAGVFHCSKDSIWRDAQRIKLRLRLEDNI